MHVSCSEIVVLINVMKILLDLLDALPYFTDSPIALQSYVDLLIFLRIIYQNVFDLFMIDVSSL